MIVPGYEESSSSPLTIVAEVSRNWPFAFDGDERLLSQKFEYVIGVNHGRGYVLKRWNLSRVVTGEIGNETLNESIIAVFEKREPVAKDCVALIIALRDLLDDPLDTAARVRAAKLLAEIEGGDNG